MSERRAPTPGELFLFVGQDGAWYWYLVLREGSISVVWSVLFCDDSGVTSTCERGERWLTEVCVRRFLR